MQNNTSTQPSLIEVDAAEMARNLPRITYKDLPIVTTELLANAYGAKAKNLQENYRNHQDRFIDGIHFYKLEGNDLRDFKKSQTQNDLVGDQASSLMLWTERGAARHAKVLNTDQAWDVFEAMEDSYFHQTKAIAIYPLAKPLTGRDIISAMTQTTKLIGQMRRETSPSVRTMLFGQLKQLCQVHSWPLPELSELGGAVPSHDVTLMEFWSAWQDMQPELLNHSRDPSLIALNLSQVMSRAEEMKIRLPAKAELVRILKLSQSPRFVDMKSVNSVLNAKANTENPEAKLPPTVKCWVFEVVEG